ncbi:tyrosinase tyrosinase: common central domain protein [Rhizoctonia solani AG-3 Rhs1AP]|uniref:Tyrosinase tyrosinase: common central domain protein n=2 Tax=Rhizoctonia solani AG-3 TaxID=1086053 RepID=A0A074SDG0_9AGAM|nr:tyrosinase tyrosinase: common central domain protein [Rhizoctonia solani AG-3 Rhs1AP]KEP48087.1 tyrosinase tyrosinase: common central domain protein [Rhizoctonia solani 123E]
MMKFALVLLPFAIAVAAASIKTELCRDPELRVEWRTMTEVQRDSYHKAVKCMQTKRVPSSGGMSQYDYFAWMYMAKYKEVHQTAAFLPWQRYFSFAYDQLTKECGYSGHTPYWDWTKDAMNMTRSPIFDPVVGFGGNGKGQGNCVQDGPYGIQSGFKLRWPWEQCLQRKFAGMVSSPKGFLRPATGPEARHSVKQVNALHRKKDFMNFAPGLEYLHHSVVSEIGLIMASSVPSLDPLFLVHINNIDRLWNLWQRKDDRTLGGYQNIVPIHPKGFPALTPPASLDDLIKIGPKDFFWLKGFPELKVRDLLATNSRRLCYTVSMVSLARVVRSNADGLVQVRQV